MIILYLDINDTAMGKLPNGILGPIRGKVGTVVGSSWKGIEYIKKAPKGRSAKRAPGEKLNQDNFAILHRWLQPILPFLRDGFKDYSPTVTGYNAAKSYNLKHAFVVEKGKKKLDPSLIQVSYGDLPLPAHISMEKQGENFVTFHWDPANVEGGSPYDQAMLLAYDVDNSYDLSWRTAQFRKTGTDTIELPKQKGRTYHIYIAFTAHDRSRQSHSVYLGTVVI